MQGQLLIGTPSENLQPCPDILLRSHIFVELGNSRLVSHPDRSGLDTCLDIEPYRLTARVSVIRNLQATLINGGPRALASGTLIVVTGALAQSASLAEMASAQPIAGAQYVCTTRGRPRGRTDDACSIGLMPSHQIATIDSSLGCRA